MKLLYCEICMDLVRPVVSPRYCMCERHAVWAAADHSQVYVYDRQANGRIPEEPKAHIVLISNRLLHMQGPMRRNTSAQLLAQSDRNSWFGASQSLVVRVRPGEHPKTVWADIPHTSGGAHVSGVTGPTARH